MSDNIILIGPMGAGKTTLGKKLARYFNRPFIDIDQVIQERLGVSIQTIFDTEGEAGFRRWEHKILLSVLQEQNNAVISTGGGCVMTEACRQLIRRERLVIHADINVNKQYERLQYDKKRPVLQGVDLREKLVSLREERHDIYCALADVYLATSQTSFRKIILTVETNLSS